MPHRYDDNSPHATMEAKFSNGNLMTSLRQSRLNLVDIVRQQFGTKCDESEARNITARQPESRNVILNEMKNLLFALRT